jgi:linoleoyl-CoA desaturase
VSDTLIDRVDAGTGAADPVRPWNPSRLIRPTEAELARARRTLHRKAVAIGAVTVASYWVLVFSSTGFAVRSASAVVLAAALTAVATGIMHDANHGAFSRSRRVNRLMGYSLDLLGGSSWMWRHRHNVQHHASTNVVGVDQDIDQAPFARLAPQQAWRRWHRYQHLYLWPVYGLLALRWLVGDLITLARNDGDSPPPHPGRRRSVAMVVLGKFLHLGWAVVIPLAFHPWWAVAGFYLAISWAIGLLAALIFQMAHCVEEAEFVAPGADHRGRHFQLHQLRTTLDVQCPVPGLRHVVRFMMGGLDHQIEHHLAPGLPHTIYPVLAERLATACATHDLPYRSHPSVTAALRSHYRWLKRMGSGTSAAPAP